MKLAIATMARGRELHLERQAAAVRAIAPDEYVVVSLDETPHEVPGATVLHRPAAPPLPLAASRNVAIAAARADAVAWLDVDCIPEPRFLDVLAAALRRTRGEHLLAGPVGRLGPMDRAPTVDDLHAARPGAAKRPVPPDGGLLAEDRYELFWSLSFAVTHATHAGIGGFDEGYTGYGAEDTDYGFRARQAGVPFTWVGGAWAHHQHHPVSDPPVEYADDILRNATRFHERWGAWPMEDWLSGFAARGLVNWPGAPAHRR